jgi:hypothetical protein
MARKASVFCANDFMLCYKVASPRLTVGAATIDLRKEPRCRV